MADARGGKRKAEKTDDFFHVRANGQYLKVPKGVKANIFDGTEGQVFGNKKKRKPSRKDQRKKARAEKKAKKVAFFSKNREQASDSLNSSVTQKKKPNVPDPNNQQQVSEPVSREKKKTKRKGKGKKPYATREAHLQKLLEDNKKEDNEIKRLEKLLKVDRKKQDHRKFKTDGLDYLLEVCGPLSGLTEDGDGDNRGDNDGDVNPSSKVRKGKSDNKGRSTCMDFDEREVNSEVSNECRSVKDFDTSNQGQSKKDKNSSADDGCSSDNEFGDNNDYSGWNDDNDYDNGDNGGEDNGGGNGSEDDKDNNKDDDNDDDDDDDDDDGDISDRDQDFNREPGTESDEQGRINAADDNENRTSQKYIPPHLRTQGPSEAKCEHLNRVRRQIKGLLNRLSEGNLSVISNEVETLFTHNSRNDMNKILSDIILDSCVSVSLMPDKLLMEHVMLLVVLNNHIGIEIGAFFVERLAELFNNLHKKDGETYGQGKECFNVVALFSHLYNFKIIHCCLIYDVIRRLAESFTGQDVELLLLLLKNSGAEIRRDDPASLKDIILQIQAKVASAVGLTSDSRVRFMLEIISNLRNNNLRKIPGYDPSQVERLRKVLRSVTRDSRRGVNNQLKINLEDLLNTGTKGRWWIVGSAWSGKLADSSVGSTDSAAQMENSKLFELARKQRMNTDVRKNVFFVMMTSEDYIDAFEKLLRLNLKDVQTREIIHVLIDCCLQEKTYNPYYAYLGQKFCEYSRSYQITFQFSFWDKFKVLSDLSSHSLSNLSSLMCHLITTRALSLAILKAVDFVELDKPSVRFFTQLFQHILLDYSLETTRNVFERIAAGPNLSSLRQSLRIFIKHFVVKTKKSKSEDRDSDLQERLKLADKMLGAFDAVKL